MNVYVASPYQIPTTLKPLLDGVSDENIAKFIDWRARRTLEVTARLQYAAWQLQETIFYYSPIGYEHLLAESIPHADAAFRADGDYWMDIDRSVLSGMDHIVVAGLPGWSYSTGVREEVGHFANLIGPKIYHLQFDMGHHESNPFISSINKIFAMHERTNSWTSQVQYATASYMMIAKKLTGQVR